jgi:hypothetical protein
MKSHIGDAVEFFNVLTGPELLELTEAHLPEHRAAVSADGGVVDVHDAGVERGRLVPEGGERLGGAT